MKDHVEDWQSEKGSWITIIWLCVCASWGCWRAWWILEWSAPSGVNVCCFLSSLPYFPSLSHHGSVWVLPIISLLLTCIVSPVRACLFIWLERLCGTQKEDECGPLQSSLSAPTSGKVYCTLCKVHSSLIVALQIKPATHRIRPVQYTAILWVSLLKHYKNICRCMNFRDALKFKLRNPSSFLALNYY